MRCSQVRGSPKACYRAIQRCISGIFPAPEQKLRDQRFSIVRRERAPTKSDRCYDLLDTRDSIPDDD